MSENRSYRINTNINKDNVVNVQISQDIDCLEILSLKINQVDTYRLQSANYGVIVGRVLANEGFGVPNVKVSVFIELDKVDKENPDITTIYPYTSLQTRDKDGIKYNLLPDNANGNGDCYRIVGTFPNKRLVLDNESQLEIFDKYWKYTTVTNNAGDYMIFGVPVGVHTVHIDCDLSDIGILSQKPRDFYYKGYEKTNFENASQFKESTNLDDLVQIISQDKSIQVYPFWGDKDSADVIALSRCDLNLAYKFEPTCVFMGSVITDDYSNAIGHTCSPSKKVGYNNRLTTNRGTIEMIRKTPDGAVEEYQVQGNEVVDGDGVWCYQIPMNLDYIKTDEYGNIVPTDNPNEGIATRTRARFRLSIEETYNEGISRHRAKMLIPNNLEAKVVSNGGGVKLKDDTEWEKCFQFGSRTPENQYRDLYWNKIYSVKSYIPRIQTNNNVKTHNYSAIRSVNLDTTNNPHPFNRIRLNVPFAYTILCVLLKIVFLLAFVLNGTVISLLNTLAEVCIPPFKLKILGKKLYWCVFEFLETDCISFTFPGAAPDGGDECYVPGCWNKAKGQGSCSTNYKRLTDRLEQALAQEYNVVNLDFYNDWVNGTVYMPLWFWKKTKKKKYLFGLFRKKAVNTFCNCSRNFKKTRIFETCALEKTAKFKPKNGNSKNPDKTKNSFLFRYGIIKEFQNKDGLNVYYYAPGVRNESGQYGRLYSTDLILLGSFMDCDLDGITNICDKLPSTTANIPFLSTIREQPEDGGDDSFSDIVPGGDSVDGATADDADGSTEENAVLNQSVEITGMDWTYKGKDSNPTYKDGLFFDIGCGKTETRTKTCINLGRMSELGVSLDSGYYIKYPSGNGFKEKYIEPDGMILRHELDDIDTRAAFATMNHGRLVGDVENSNTKYKSYLLYYTYPMNFDGAMESAIRSYDVDFEDYQDESYVKFRYGLDVESDQNLSIKDAVRYNDSFLLTNNSFYFYFGLHPGKTAIEKYQELYNANCSNNKKYTQAYDIIATNSSGCNNDGNITIDFSYIRPPYTITMTYINDKGNETIVKFKKESNDGDTIYNSNILPKCSTAKEYEYEDKIESEELKIIISGLTNNDYTLKIADVNGREVTEFVELNPPIVSINEVIGQQVDMKYVPNSGQKVSGGTIYLGDWVYENESWDVDSIQKFNDNDSLYIVTLSGTSTSASTSSVEFEIRVSFKSMYPKDNTEWEISDCIQSVSITDNKVKFNVNIPGYYEFEIQRICCNQTLDDGICNQILDDGILFERVFVPNNIQFQLRLNGTPVDAIVSGWTTEWGNASDSGYPFNVHVADTYYNSDLVPTNIINDPEYKMVTSSGISYLTKDNILLWKDYISGLINMGDDSIFWEGQTTNNENKLAELIESLQNKIGNEKDEACEEGWENCSLYSQLNKLNQDAANGDDKSSEIEYVKKQIAEKEKELAEAKELKVAYEEFKIEQDKIVRHNLYLILEFRLKSILQMSKGMYTYFGASAPSFKLTTAGGENPCVICSEYPDYGECNIPEDDLLKTPQKATVKQVIHSPSISRIQGQSSFPTIVPKNYGVVIDANTNFVTYQNNGLYNSLILKGDTSIGNYVAAFDNNMEDPYHTQPTSGPPSPSGFTDMTETTYTTIQSGYTANFCKTHFIDTSIDYVFTVISPLTKECIIKGVNDDVDWGTGCVYGNIIGGVKMKTQEEQLISTASTTEYATEYAYEINTDDKFVKLSSVPIADSGKTFCKCEIYVKNNNPEDKSNHTLELNPKDDSIFTQNYDGWLGITTQGGLKKSTLLKRDGHEYFSKETYPEITCVGCDKIPSGVTNVSVNISSYSYDISPELQYDESGYASGITLNASMGEECDVELIGENSLGLSIVFGSIVRYNFPSSSSSDERKVRAIDCRFKLNPNMSGKSYTKQLIGCRMTTTANTEFESDEGYLNWNDGRFSGGTLDSKIAWWDTLTSWADSAPFRLSYKGENTEYVNGYLRDKESKKYLDDSYIDGNFVLQTSDINSNVNSFAIFCKNTRFGGELSSGDLHLKQITQYQVLKTIDVRPFELTTHKSEDYITGGTITPKYDILSIDDDAIKFSSEASAITATTIDGSALYLYDHIKVYTSTDITNEDNILDKEFYDITANIKKEENTETYYITKIKLEFVLSTDDDIIKVPEDSGTTCYSFKGLKPDDSFLDLKNPKVFIGITCSNQLTYMFRWDDWKLARTKIVCPSDTATNNRH